ncbi:uncharacterized protein FTJAE_3699 [Fusarium tjaetaba]|uniref:Uncharacterized protein n=1 Tax=Fusarium tjaetaba TaxID=1567544 RepID=A0A8H5S033_9HYPO|nr:uncharacterized protein FTJAE_3699 [Fusarium tjaetaba]KAF5642224.1 hypothetical protein FTJAE_3699 [Fusarium tjaetaba]
MTVEQQIWGKGINKFQTISLSFPSLFSSSIALYNLNRNLDHNSRSPLSPTTSTISLKATALSINHQNIMATIPDIAFRAVGQIGFWKSALDGVKETYPTLRNDAPRRQPTYLPPPLPVEQKMREIYRFQWAVDESIVFLRDNATNVEEVMVFRVVEWLGKIQRDDTGRIQRIIWTLDPERLRRELRDGHAHLVNGQARVGPAPSATAGANAGSNSRANTGGAAGDAARGS